MANATPHDARQNHELADQIVSNEPGLVAAQVGIHALAKLADMMPAAEFLEFVNGALQHATTGQLPQDNEGAEGAEQQPGGEQ